MKNLKDLGRILNKEEQKMINGGTRQGHCPVNHCINLSGGCTNMITAILNDCA